MNLYERSASALRRTRLLHASLHPLSHLSILAKSYLTVSASSVSVEAMFNLWVDPQSEEECTGGVPRQHYYVYSRQILSTLQSIGLSTAWGLNDFAVINDTHPGLIYKTS